jgi:hypothetical protein
MLEAIATTDAAIIAAGVTLHLADRHVFRTGTIERAGRAARILSGTDDVAVPGWRQPRQLAKACGMMVTAAWRGRQGTALPRWARVALVAGFVIPIAGPVDEIAGLLTLAIIACHRGHRATVVAAWRDAAQTC